MRQPTTMTRRILVVVVLLLALFPLVADVTTGGRLSGPPAADAAVAPGVSIFPNTLRPRERAVRSTRRSNVGVRFASKAPGVASAVRYFRSPRNRGPHRVQLWSPSGRLVARGRYAGRRTGWVTVPLDHGVRIRAGRQYVASYVAPRGHFSRTRRALYSTRPVTRHGLSAYAGVIGHGRGMPSRRTHDNYFVDVVFRATPQGRSLNLPRIAWEGGPAYWRSFAKAHQSGWDNPRFFPVSVFLGKPEQAAALKALGVNTYMGAEHDGTPLRSVTGPGMYVIAQQDEFTPAEVGTNPAVVGWFVSDECEMGYSGCPEDEAGSIAMERQYVAKVRSYHDGRFAQANFGNGILGTWWAPNTMADHVRLMDVASADKYTYTSPDVGSIVPDSPFWPQGATVARAASYGWQVDQMRRFQDPRRLRPVWTFVETAQPLLDEPGARTITPAQLEGAVWSAIIHEARGIAFFQHNNNGVCGTYSLVECGTALASKVTALTRQIRALAVVINSQSYRYDFANGTDTMLKTYGDNAYVFADLGLLDSPGSKTFRLPPGVTGKTVAVVGENRTLPVVNGSFTDSFAAEYSHHIYRIAL